MKASARLMRVRLASWQVDAQEAAEDRVVQASGDRGGDERDRRAARVASAENQQEECGVGEGRAEVADETQLEDGDLGEGRDENREGALPEQRLRPRLVFQAGEEPSAVADAQRSRGREENRARQYA